MHDRSKSRSRWTAWAAGCAAAALMPTVWAQSRQVMITDDGSGPSVMHFSMPDFGRLHTPDYERRDLPIFVRTLVLNQDQEATVETLLELYLEEYRKVASELLPPPSSQRMQMAKIGGMDGEPSIDGIVLGGLGGGAFDPTNLDIDVGPGGAVAVRIGASVGEPMRGGGGEGEEGTFDVAVTTGEDGDEGMPSAGVFIAVDTPEGEELSAELIERLEAHAAEMAERIQEQIENGELGPGGMMGHGPEQMAMHRMRMEEINARAAEFKAKRVALRQRFETDVRVQLEPDQVDRWPVLERTLNRKKTLPLGRLDGERTDLIEVVERLDLAPAPDDDLAATLRDYEVALHEALKRRNATVETSQAVVDESLGAGDHTKALTAIDRATQTRVAVRNTNDQFAQSIAAQLPAEKATTFVDEVNRLSFPRVYRVTRAEKAFDAVLARSDLDPKLRAVVQDLQRAYTDELTIVNDGIRRDIMRFQPGESRRSIEHIAVVTEGRMDVGMPEDPVKPAFDKRRTLEDRYIGYVRDMLPEAMVAEVSELQPRAERKSVLIEQILGGQAK